MIGLWTALATFALHASALHNYGLVSDELYFIACSQHLAWGYVDQPPLVAIVARLSAPFGYNPIALRLLPALSAALAAWLAAAIAGELGGGRFARGLAAVATALVPAYLLLGNLLVTTSFEPLSWSLVIYFTIRAIKTGKSAYWYAIAAAFTFGMYGKYSMLLLGAAVAIGLLLTPERRIFRTRAFPIAAALALLAIAPNLAWQWSHGFPFLGVLHGDFQHRHPFQSGMMLEYKSFGVNALAFIAEQLLYTSPAIAAIWIWGAIALARSERLRAFRWIAIAFVLLIAAAIALEGKGYYVIAIYVPLIAAGCVAIEGAWQRTGARSAATAVLLATTLPLVPFALPVLPIESFLSYSQALGLTGAHGTPPHVVQPLYAQEFGWDQFAQRVAQVYAALPPRVRARTAVFADTYGEAGALALYGPKYHLPTIIGSQNNFYLWGPNGYDGSSMIVVGATQQETIRRLFRHVTLVTTIANPYEWVLQGPDPVYYCTDPIAPLAQIWPQLGWYGA
ncbi:MAG: glycosyltransferase family 39 protein [bacterium]|nr:glycosyltransferase family 39 protein [bacterium]